MKKLFGLGLFLVISFTTLSQVDSLRVYQWEEVSSADPDTIYGISLSKRKLDTIPAELARFTSLKYLDLSKNRLTELPLFLGDLSALEVVDLSRNEFSVYPIELCRLTNLKKLILNRNSFDRIPECIGYCVDLEYLDLWNTPVMGFPNSMINLKKLKVIDLQGVKYGPTFQEDFKRKLYWVNIKFDPPCDCME